MQSSASGNSGAGLSRSRSCSTPSLALRSVLRYIESIQATAATITVLIPEIIPSKRRHEILHNQRGRLLEAALKSDTDGVVIAALPFHIHD